MSEQLEFKISTGLKNIIGQELITDNDIAIFELVKNSYDAGAKKVQIFFENIKNNSKGSPKIILIDDGKGMSYEDITEKWLFVGYSEKKEVMDEADYRHKIKKRKRILAGYKGIGRFSADRLGPNLNMYTKTSDKNEIHFIQMDWQQFEKDQLKKFETVKVNYDKVDRTSLSYLPITSFSHGTILEISPLRDTWDESRLVSLKKYLQKLINPSYDPENQDFKIELIVKDFEKEDEEQKDPNKIINGLIHNLVFEKLNIKTTQILCDIEDGEVTTELTDKGKFVYKLKEKLGKKYHELNDVSVKVFYLNPNAKRVFTTIMGIEPVRYGSIFLYKNGFRIHPYGDEGNDWLELEKRKTQGTRRFLATREIMGRIEVYGHQSGFQEVSSRSGGVVKSPELSQLTQFFIEQVLRKLERYVVEAINWDTEDIEKQKTDNETKKATLNIISKLVGKEDTTDLEYNDEFLKIFKDRQEENVDEVIKNFETLKKYAKSTKEKTQIDRHVREVKNVTKVLASKVKREQDKVKELEKDKFFLNKALSHKEQLENLHHSVKISSQMIESSITKINTRIKKGQGLENILPLIDAISIENQKIKSLVDIVKFAKFNMKARKITEDIVMYVKEYLTKIIEKRSMSLGYKFYNDNFKLEHRFVPMEISIILDNLLDNADKSRARNIAIRFEKKGSNLLLYFGDDGKGVKDSDVESIFVRGFSTTGGSGIGLHHISEMLESRGGSVKFLGNNMKRLGKGACFEVMLKST